MKLSNFLPFLVGILILGCSKNINYTPEHVEQTSGRYQYNQNEVLDVYYESNDLYLKWKGGAIKPVILDVNTFFVPDMYQKLRFVVHPESKKRYLAVVSEDDDSKVSYDYPKMDDAFKTPWMHFIDGEYEQATEGYLKLQQQDSTKSYIDEQQINRKGYDLLREKDHGNAIKVFQMNVALYPGSDNVYDSLADAFLRSGDSLQAYNNYKKSFELNSGNQRAKDYMKVYEQNHN